jgi:hypothetical protein
MTTTGTPQYSVIAFYGTHTLTTMTLPHLDPIEAARRLIQAMSNILLPKEEFVQIAQYTNSTTTLTIVAHEDVFNAARAYVADHFDGGHSAWTRTTN